MNQRYVLSVLALSAGLVLADSVTSRVSAADPAGLAEVTVVGKSRGGGQTSIFLKFGGKTINQEVYFTLLELDAKTLLITIIDFDKLKGDMRMKEKAAGRMQKAASMGKRVAIKGHLVPQSEKVNTGAVRLLDEEILTLKEKKQLILLAEAMTGVDDSNKDQFPAHGKVRAEGKPVCGKADLKLLDEPTLALENGSQPIILSGGKAKAKAGKAPIRVVGSLAIDDKGLLRLVADEVKELSK